MNYNSVEIKEILRKEYPYIIREFIDRNEIFRKRDDVENIVNAFVQANYGAQATFRGAFSNISNIAHMSVSRGQEITSEFIIKNIGGEKARAHYYPDSLSKLAGKTPIPSYKVEDIDSAITELTSMKRISLNSQQSKIIHEIEREWQDAKIGGDPNADKIITLSNGNESVDKVNAMKTLLKKYGPPRLF